MTLFCQPKEPYDELWNGARTGLDGAREIFGADEVRSSSHARLPPAEIDPLTQHLQAVDAHVFARRLEHILASKPDSPIYIDLPAVSHTALSRTRQRPAKSRSLMDYLSRSGAQTKPDDVDEVLKMLDKRDVRSAAAEVERLRLIKSEAEVQVMRKAADASSAAHAKVRLRPAPLLPFCRSRWARCGGTRPRGRPDSMQR